MSDEVKQGDKPFPVNPFPPPEPIPCCPKCGGEYDEHGICKDCNHKRGK
jgi:hypothetical protein